MYSAKNLSERVSVEIRPLPWQHKAPHKAPHKSEDVNGFEKGAPSVRLQKTVEEKSRYKSEIVGCNETKFTGLINVYVVSAAARPRMRGKKTGKAKSKKVKTGLPGRYRVSRLNYFG